MQAAAGTPIATVQKLLGHASVQTTMTHYMAMNHLAHRVPCYMQKIIKNI
jgi:integrase